MICVEFRDEVRPQNRVAPVIRMPVFEVGRCFQAVYGSELDRCTDTSNTDVNKSIPLRAKFKCESLIESGQGEAGRVVQIIASK